MRAVAITGLGMVTPLGSSAAEVLARMARGESAAAAPTRFDASPFACRRCAEIADFRPEDYVDEPKALRLMNRDAQLAAAAARLAMRDARLAVGRHYADGEVALFGATGLASLPVEDIARMVRLAAAPDGRLDLRRFGEVALKRIRPVLSFKILSNMPVCFVSIFEALRGPNAVYSPWEGQGAQAIAAGVRAIRRGDVPCALVGGCDTKANEFAFLALQQHGALAAGDDGEPQGHRGRRGDGAPAAEGDGGRLIVPGEGAAFLVLEEEAAARTRGAGIYARIADFALASADGAPAAMERARLSVSESLCPAPPHVLVAARPGRGHAPALSADCATARAPTAAICPKAHVGDLFAAAAAVQVALAAAMLSTPCSGRRALAECFGHGSEQAAFLLESP